MNLNLTEDRVKPLLQASVNAKKRVTKKANKQPQSKTKAKSISSLTVKQSITVLPVTEELTAKVDQSFVMAEPETKYNELSFDLQNLPISFANHWFLDRKKDRVSNTTRCLLSSAKKNFNAGYNSESFIFLQVTRNAALIKTGSTLAMKYPEMAVYIDKQTLIPFEQIFGDSSVLMKNNFNQLIVQLQQAKNITIKLGFLPGRLKAGASEVVFSLADFAKAYQSLLACEKF